ncbi:MAG TPA: 2-amino-4-hydroxy-6-hydroxymethyldihydropteridine diphosphokinase [Polyangiaceae bacterium]
MIGLGSNLGDCRDQLARAVGQIRALGDVVSVSALYETDPIGPPQPSFLNAALRLRTKSPPLALLDELLEVERHLGRIRRERWGPRVIDLDILWCSGVAVRTERLVVPHSELRARAFALVPLLDVAPEARDPNDLTPYALIAASMDTNGVREVPGTRGTWSSRSADSSELSAHGPA